MNKNIIETSADDSIVYTLVFFNICLVCLCVILTSVSLQDSASVTSSETIETMQ